MNGAPPRIDNLAPGAQLPANGLLKCPSFNLSRFKSAAEAPDCDGLGATGNALGMPTVQTLRPGVPPAANAQWRIKSFDELSKLIPKIHLTAHQ